MADQHEDSPGTLFLSHAALNKKKLWIGLSSGHRGVITINEGAVSALIEKKASLLSVGVTDVSGQFQAGDIVQINSSTGEEIGRGISNLQTSELIKIKGLAASELPNSHKKTTEVIHRDNIVIFKEIGY